MHEPRWIPCMLLLGLLAPAPAWSANEVQTALDEITGKMRGVRSVQVSFRQEKAMAMFSAPIELRGTLVWEHPDSFAWRVAEPFRYVLILRQGTLRQWEGDQNTVQEFSLSSNPVMRVALQQLQRWFGGEYGRLTEDYDVSLVGRAPLTLACVPHAGSPEAGFVERITIQFQEDLRYVRRIVITERSGDVTTLRFERPRLNEAIPREAWTVGAAGPHD